MPTLQTRQPEGIPIGGQFALTAHSEAAMKLAAHRVTVTFDYSAVRTSSTGRGVTDVLVDSDRADAIGRGSGQRSPGRASDTI